jgi:prepilin-type N-terminal cleavage/methylation domain-containing protein
VPRLSLIRSYLTRSRSTGPQPKHCGTTSGFTLLEMILVLTIIGLVAGVILPNLRFSLDSAISVGMKDFLAQVQATQDDAVLSGQIRRMVINIKKGEYWAETPPPSFVGRPPLVSSRADSMFEDSKKTLYEFFSQSEKNESNRQSNLSTSDNPIYYSIRSIPLVRKDILQAQPWLSAMGSGLSKQNLPREVAVSHFSSILMRNVLEYESGSVFATKDDSLYGYIYFFGDGTLSDTSIQFASLNGDGHIEVDGQKYTIQLSPLTGKADILEGEQEPEFTRPEPPSTGGSS